MILEKKIFKCPFPHTNPQSLGIGICWIGTFDMKNSDIVST